MSVIPETIAKTLVRERERDASTLERRTNPRRGRHSGPRRLN